MEHKNVSSLFTIHSRAIHDHSRSVADKKIILETNWNNENKKYLFQFVN